jgi:ketosteroid isomerase-like protein
MSACRKLLSLPSLAIVVALFACAILGKWSLTAAGTSAPPVVWNAAAGKDLEKALMNLHEAWNTLDMKAMDRMIAGDDQLVTFDLDPNTSQPIVLHSKADLMKFTQTIFDGFKQQGVKSIAEHPMINCKVSGNLGFCTEQCKIKLISRDGSTDIARLRGTAIAERTSDGWKWLEWHMSPDTKESQEAEVAHSDMHPKL